MKKFTHIVTHGGPAHQDEFLACCLLISAKKEINMISRENNPTIEDGVIMVDVAQQYDPAKGLFDHHQLPAAGAGSCALHLVAEWLDIPLEYFKWAEVVGVIDCGVPEDRNPLNPAAWAGNPLIRYFLDQFQDVSEMDSSHPLWNVMKKLGEGIIAESNIIESDIAKLNESIYSNGVLDARGWNPSFAATGAVSAKADVDFLLVDARTDNQVNIIKKGDKPFRQCWLNNATFQHPAGFMLVVPEEDLILS